MRILLVAGTFLCALVASAVAAGGIVLMTQYARVVGLAPGLAVTAFSVVSLAAAVHLVIARRHRPAVELAAALLAMLPSTLLLASGLYIGGLPAGANWTLWLGLALLIGSVSALFLGVARMRGRPRPSEPVAHERTLPPAVALERAPERLPPERPEPFPLPSDQRRRAGGTA